MSKHTKEQISALNQSAVQKREETINRVKLTLGEMEINNMPITFKSVSETAKVSRNWLYSENEISEFIKKFRGKETILNKSVKQQKLLDMKDKEIETLKRQVELMTSKIARLKKQVEVAYGELYNKI